MFCHFNQIIFLSRAMNPKRTITQQQIDRQMEKYLKKVEEDIKATRTELRAPTTAFLLQIKAQVQSSVDHGISFKQIAQSIEESFGFRMTENSIKNFVNDYLTINKKRGRKGIGSEPSREKRKERKEHLPKSSKEEKISRLSGMGISSSDGDEF